MNVAHVADRRSSSEEPSPRILVVEDDPDAREALSDLLTSFGYEVATAGDGDEALAEVEREIPDLVVSDVCMPHTDGFRMVERLRSATGPRYVPVILVSARSDIERRVIGLDVGADDYIAKPVEAEELLARVRAQLRRVERQKELLQRTILDELTGVLNRRGLIDVLEREFKRADRLQSPLSVLVVDVDDFKEINDTYGHAVGDAVLERIADFLGGQLRGSDQVGRLGGDEFVVILPHTSGLDAGALAERLRTMDRVGVELPGAEQLEVHLSVGAATCHPGRDLDVGSDELLHRADQAMYREKRSGKDRRRRTRH
jgi:two-component system, cell cycle response regulator